MKRIYYGLGVFFLLSILCCSTPREYTIEFCTNLSDENECDSSLTTFQANDRVYVLFECNQPFHEKVVTGIIFLMERNERIELGEQEWNINAGDSYVYDYIDFTEVGSYEIEFRNKNSEVLATKRLSVE